MSPILVRPVREQLEHDRIIRLLQAKSRRRYEVGINPGAEQNAPVGTGAKAIYPDIVFYSQERGRKVEGVVEVETGESVNHLEALAQWAHFARLKVPFHLYVPAATIDIARRLSADHQISVAELWIYDSIGDQVRFTLVQRAPGAPRQAAHTKAAPSRTAAARPGPVTRPAPAARTPPAAKSAKAARTGRPGSKRAAPARSARKPAPRKSAVSKSSSAKRR